MFKLNETYVLIGSDETYKCVWANATHAALFCEARPIYSGVYEHGVCGPHFKRHTQLVKGWVNVYRTAIPGTGSSIEGVAVGFNIFKTEEAAKAAAGVSIAERRWIATVEIEYDTKE